MTVKDDLETIKKGGEKENQLWFIAVNKSDQKWKKWTEVIEKNKI